MVEQRTYICPVCNRIIEWAEDDNKLHFDVYNPVTRELLGTVCEECYRHTTPTSLTKILKDKYNQPIEYDDYSDL